jgi:hypothetical protein
MSFTIVLRTRDRLDLDVTCPFVLVRGSRWWRKASHHLNRSDAISQTVEYLQAAHARKQSRSRRADRRVRFDAAAGPRRLSMIGLLKYIERREGETALSMHPGFLWRCADRRAAFLQRFSCSVSHPFLDRISVKT